MQARTNFRRFRDGGADFLCFCAAAALSGEVLISGNASMGSPHAGRPISAGK
jgi:hypothetical protein